jgi:ketosteroid isomerase-like protein
VGLSEQAMSQENVELVRSIYASWERGDYSSVEWAHPEIDYMILLGGAFPPVSVRGRDSMREAARGVIEVWEEQRIEADEYRALDGERVLVLDHASGRGKRSGLERAQLGSANGAHLFHLRDGKVTRLIAYGDRERALADLGLSE